MKLNIAFWAAVLIVVSAPVLCASKEDPARRTYDPVIRKVAQKHGLDTELMHAIIRAESNYDSFAVSEKGALGLMQLMPATATAYGVKDYFDPEQNIEGGAKYLKDLIKLYNGTTKLVLAAYNAGQEAVKKYKGIPPYAETRTYISRILASYSRSTIRNKTIIYKYYDASGTLVLTNDPRLYALGKAR